MSRIEDRRKAIELRLSGKTYSEIKNALQLSKSTLSNWLSNYPLTETQKKKLMESVKHNKYLAIEKIRATKFKKKQSRLKKAYKTEEKKLLPFNQEEFYLSGLFLYWGEGVKGFNSTVSLNNTDPKVVIFFYHWLTKALHVPKKRVRVILHLYQDMDIQSSINFWSKTLGISPKQFIKPYVKKTLKSLIDQKGFGHGTCGLYVYNSALKERIMSGIKVVADHYSLKDQS